MPAIKALVVDDNMVFLRAALLTLGELPQVEVVGSARSGEAALSIAKVKRPDLILMDVSMPGMDGITTAARIRSDGLAAKIVLMSLSGPLTLQPQQRGFMFDGFMSKAHFADEIHDVIKQLFPQAACTNPGVPS